MTNQERLAALDRIERTRVSRVAKKRQDAATPLRRLRSAEELG